MSVWAGAGSSLPPRCAGVGVKPGVGRTRAAGRGIGALTWRFSACPGSAPVVKACLHLLHLQDLGLGEVLLVPGSM